MSYQQNSSRLRRLPDFFGITDSSGLMPLSQIRDNGMINNGPRQPTVDELEQQAKSGTPISLLELSEAVHREKKQEQQAPKKAPEKRPSVIARLRAPLPAATNLVRDNAERDL